MSVLFKIILIVVSIITFIYVGRMIGTSKMKIQNAVPIVLFFMMLIIISLFPQIIFFAADILQIKDPSNCAFLIVGFCLLMIVFSLIIRIAILENKLSDFVQKYAIDSKLDEDNKGQ